MKLNNLSEGLYDDYEGPVSSDDEFDKGKWIVTGQVEYKNDDKGWARVHAIKRLVGQLGNPDLIVWSKPNSGSAYGTGTAEFSIPIYEFRDGSGNPQERWARYRSGEYTWTHVPDPRARVTIFRITRAH